MDDIFEYKNIKSQLYNQSYFWKDIIEIYERIFDYKESRANFAVGLYGNSGNKEIIFFQIFNEYIVEWKYCKESAKLIVESYRVHEIKGLILEYKSIYDVELKYKINDREVSLNNFDNYTNSGEKLRDSLINFYRVLIR